MTDTRLLRIGSDTAVQQNGLTFDQMREMAEMLKAGLAQGMPAGQVEALADVLREGYSAGEDTTT